MRSLQIFKIWGIPFKFHPYWFVVFFLFTLSIANQVNQTTSQLFNNKEAWLIGFLTSFFLLGSIISHEIIHTFVSLNQGVKIKKITFYFLGAILQTEKDCQNALGNIKIALVRPALCFFTALILLFISSTNQIQNEIVFNIITRVAVLNFFIGILNLIPLGSLDGGNLLKSIIWYFSGSRNQGRYFLNKLTFFLSLCASFFGVIFLFNFNFYYGLTLSILGLFGINASRSESQFFKIEKILKLSTVSELKLKPLRKIEFSSNLNEFNNLIKDQKERKNKYFFLTKEGRWEGYIDKKILNSVSIKKWERTFVGDFKKPLEDFYSITSDTELWKAIKKIEKSNEAILLVVNSGNIPLGIINRNTIGYYVLSKMGINLPYEITKKIDKNNQYPLGIELPRIIKIMQEKGEI